MHELRLKVHQDDYHAWNVTDHVDAASAQNDIVGLIDEGYDITEVTFDGVRWEHYNYGATWGPVVPRGWQHCTRCGTAHPTRSEC
jgi:hypothetical protein